MDPSSATQLIGRVVRQGGQITVLTGAGISAESGIPTFRGPGGFWTVGSREYHPQEMATVSMFNRDPESVWVWYLYRMGLCRSARPNAGHRALASMEAVLGDRFCLITQNVDNLHLCAGNSRERTLQIHGNIFWFRCAAACTDDILPLPEQLTPKSKGDTLTDDDRHRLTCRRCGRWMRPHVLWFDETYNERHYRFDTALETAARTRLLITVGTTGATTLPNHIVHLVHGNGGRLVDINVADNPFGRLAAHSEDGCFVRCKSGRALAELARAVQAAYTDL
jgi:NAD-dependent deacetylase